MKKFLALLLAVCLLTSFAPVMADGELSTDGAEATMEVNLTIDREKDSFRVMIPSSLAIDTVEKKCRVDIAVDQESFKLVSFEYLNVYLKSSVNYNSSFYMVHSEDSTQKVVYKIYSECAGFSQVHPNNCVLSVKRGATEASAFKKYLEFSVDTLPTLLGVYTDTLTFGVTCANAKG